MQPSQADMNKETADEYVIRRLSNDKLKDVESIYEAVYQKKALPDYFSIKYDTAYTGVEYVGHVAYNNNNQPVAYYGVIPCFLQVGSQKFLAAQSADTMTHPGFRFKGMFVELSNLTFELCRKLGIRLIFGFPNQNSYHGAVHKLGWKLTDTMTCFMIPVQTLPLARLCMKSALTRAVYAYYSAIIKRNWKTPRSIIPNSSIEEGFIGVLRNADYQESKKYYQREVLQTDEGFVWCKFSDEIIIGDIYLTNENFPALMKKLTGLAQRLGLKRIQFHTSPGTKLHLHFASCYSAQPSFPALFQDFESGLSLEKIKFTLADIDIF